MGLKNVQYGTIVSPSFMVQKSLNNSSIKPAISDKVKYYTGNIAPYYKAQFLSFKGINPLQEIPFATENIDKIVSVIGKKIVLPVCDYDGTFAGFVPDPLKACPFGGNKAFGEMLDNLQKKGILSFILSSRDLNDFKNEGVLGQDLYEKMNFVGLKGNQFKITIPEKNARELITELNTRPGSGYNIEMQKLDNDNVRLKVEPKPLQCIQDIKEEAIRILKPLGFRMEDKNIALTVHSRELEENLKDKPEELSGRMAFMKETMENLYKKYNTQNEISAYHDPSVKIYEIIDKRMELYNKGDLLQKFVDIFGGKEKVSPVYIGDSLGKGKDDEFAFNAANLDHGISVAVDKREEQDIIKENSRNVSTCANYRLNSYQDTINFVNTLIEKIH